MIIQKFAHFFEDIRNEIQPNLLQTNSVAYVFLKKILVFLIEALVQNTSPHLPLMIRDVDERPFYKETNQLISIINQLTSFYMKGKLDLV